MLALRAVANATWSRFARLKPPSEVLILFTTGEKKPALKAGFSNVVGERGLRASSMPALRAVANATWSRFARLKPPSEVLIFFTTGEKKPALKSRFFNPTHWSQTSCATKLRYSPNGAHLTATPSERQWLFKTSGLTDQKLSDALPK